MPAAGGREGEAEHRADRRTRKEALWRSRLGAGTCSGPLQATDQNRAFFFFFLLPSLAVRERERFQRGNLTAGPTAGTDRGSSPEMNRGDSLRRRLSSLRGAWRWSTGYLFRKVGHDGGGGCGGVGGGVTWRGSHRSCSFLLSSIHFLITLSFIFHLFRRL